MIAGILTRLRGLNRDTRGTSVIELALFAPIFGVMIMGVTDLSMGYARKIEVEQAIFRALEKVAVGSVKTDYNFLKAEVASGAGVPQSAVTVDPWLECNRVRQASFTGACTAGQETSRYVSVTVATTYAPQFDFGPVAQAYANAQGNIPVEAAASLRIQ